MKTLTLSVLAVFGLATAAPAMVFGRRAEIGENVIPDQARSSIREIVRTALRHFLNFRKHTPLSDEQRTAISKLLDGHRAEIHAQLTQSRAAHRAMTAAARNNSGLKAAAEKVGNAARDRALLLARISTEVKPLLTAEQEKNLETARGEIESLVDGALTAALR